MGSSVIKKSPFSSCFLNPSLAKQGGRQGAGDQIVLLFYTNFKRLLTLKVSVEKGLKDLFRLSWGFFHHPFSSNQRFVFNRALGQINTAGKEGNAREYCFLWTRTEIKAQDTSLLPAP